MLGLMLLLILNPLIIPISLKVLHEGLLKSPLITTYFKKNLQLLLAKYAQPINRIINVYWKLRYLLRVALCQVPRPGLRSPTSSTRSTHNWVPLQSSIPALGHWRKISLVVYPTPPCYGIKGRLYPHDNQYEGTIQGCLVEKPCQSGKMLTCRDRVNKTFVVREWF